MNAARRHFLGKHFKSSISALKFWRAILSLSFQRYLTGRDATDSELTRPPHDSVDDNLDVRCDEHRHVFRLSQLPRRGEGNRPLGLGPAAPGRRRRAVRLARHPARLAGEAGRERRADGGHRSVDDRHAVVLRPAPQLDFVPRDLAGRLGRPGLVFAGAAEFRRARGLVLRPDAGVLSAPTGVGAAPRRTAFFQLFLRRLDVAAVAGGAHPRRRRPDPRRRQCRSAARQPGRQPVRGDRQFHGVAAQRRLHGRRHAASANHPGTALDPRSAHAGAEPARFRRRLRQGEGASVAGGAR